MNTEQKVINPKQIAEALEQSSRQLNPQTCESLQAIRARALDHLKQQQGGQTQHNGGHTLTWLPHNTQQWLLPVLFLAAGLVLWSQPWQAEPEYDKSRVDIAILIDDMPLEAFIDPKKSQ